MVRETLFHPLTRAGMGSGAGAEYPDPENLRALCCNDDNCATVHGDCPSDCASVCESACDVESTCLDPNCPEVGCNDLEPPCFSDSCHHASFMDLTPDYSPSSPYETQRREEIEAHNQATRPLVVTWADGPSRGEEGLYNELLEDPILGPMFRAARHEHDGSLYCCWDGCETKMANQNALLRHFNDFHNPSPEIQHHYNSCNGTIDPSALNHHTHHRTSHVDEFICCWPLCEAKFSDDYALDTHLKVDHCPKDEGFECKWNASHGEYCGARARDPNELNCHVQTLHFTPSAPSPGPDGSTLYPEIPVTTSDPNHLSGLPSPEDDGFWEPFSRGPSTRETSISHISGESGMKEEDSGFHECRWLFFGQNKISLRCGHVSDSSGELQKHIENEHLETLRKPAECICCWEGCPRCAGRPFSQKAKLERHVKSHTGYKEHECKECGKGFATPAALNQHFRTHSGEKPYTCEVCKRSFSQSTSLTVHRRIHTGEKPLECQVCGKKFSESSNLTKHKRTHAPGQFKCPFPQCRKTFHRADGLKRHEQIHNRLLKSKEASVDEEMTMEMPVEEGIGY